MSIRSIQREVDRRVRDENYLVIAMAMEKAERIVPWCSYAKYLSRYVMMKLAERRLIDRYECHGQYSGNSTLLLDIQRERSRLRALLYYNPCKMCRTCLGRRKPWPVSEPVSDFFRVRFHHLA